MNKENLIDKKIKLLEAFQAAESIEEMDSIIEKMDDAGRLFVDDLSGFNFVANPFSRLVKTHIFESWFGYFICQTPRANERFKYKQVERPASEREIAHYKSIMSNDL